MAIAYPTILPSGVQTAERCSPFQLNTLSPQARGLVAWVPLHDGSVEAWTADGVAKTPWMVTTVLSARRVKTMGSGMRGAEFNGADYVYYIPITLPQVAPFSLSCWVKCRSVASAFVIFSIQDATGHVAWLEQSTTWIFRVRTPPPAFAAVNGNAAHTNLIHLCGVQESATSRKIYENGVLVNTNTDSLNPIAFNRLVLGTRAQVEIFDGLLTDVRVYSRALTEKDLVPMVRQTTRWDLYQSTRRRVFFMSAAVGAATARVPFRTRLGGKRL